MQRPRSTCLWFQVSQKLSEPEKTGCPLLQTLYPLFSVTCSKRGNAPDGRPYGFRYHKNFPYPKRSRCRLLQTFHPLFSARCSKRGNAPDGLAYVFRYHRNFRISGRTGRLLLTTLHLLLQQGDASDATVQTDLPMFLGITKTFCGQGELYVCCFKLCIHFFVARCSKRGNAPDGLDYFCAKQTNHRWCPR